MAAGRLGQLQKGRLDSGNCIISWTNDVFRYGISLTNDQSDKKSIEAIPRLRSLECARYGLAVITQLTVITN